MKKRYFLLMSWVVVLLSCESNTPRPALELTIGGPCVREIVVNDQNIPVVFDVSSNRTADEDLTIHLSLNKKETTAELNSHFKLDKSTLRIAKGNSKAYGKLTILQENFTFGDEKNIRIDVRSEDALVVDTAYLLCNISMGTSRSPRPEYCLPVSNYGMYAGINGFEFAGIDNAVLAADGGEYFSGSGVVNYTGIRAEGVIGETYAYSVTPDWWKTSDGDIYEIVFYIDWNRDGDFGDTGEVIFRKEMDKAAASEPVTGEITIPENAVAGLTGIRIGFFSKADTQIDREGCGYIDSGEFEDYTLLIKEE